MHLVLTGRDAHPQVVELADTVSEVLEVKNTYRGISSLSPELIINWCYHRLELPMQISKETLFYDNDG